MVARRTARSDTGDNRRACLPVRADSFSGLGILLTPANQFVAAILSLASCRQMKYCEIAPGLFCHTTGSGNAYEDRVTARTGVEPVE
jgi:hypothetical protein